MTKVCIGCGQVEGVEDYDNELWNIYYRHPDMIRRSQVEPLVYFGEDFEDEDDLHAFKLAMGRNMQERGLCSECGRPDLRGLSMDELLTDEEVQEMNDMYAEQAAERRMGC